MDKIRENLFGILVGVLSLGLVAFAWFWVFAGLSALGEDGVQGDINSQLRGLRKFTKSDQPLPTEELHEHLEKQQKAISAALESGKEFYISIKNQYDRLFPGLPTDPELILAADFTPRYIDAVEEVKKEYIEAFPQAAPPEEEDDGGSFNSRRRRGDVFEGTQIDTMEDKSVEPVHVFRAMKEYWVAKRICDVLHELDIGGLKKIDFPARLAPVEDDAPKHFRAIRAEVTLDMPFHQILPLLSRLYSKPQVDEANPEEVPAVPFYELEELTIDRNPESVVVPIVVEKAPSEEGESPGNGNGGAAGGAKALRDPAPDVSVAMKISALDWLGLQEAEKKDEDDEDDEDD